MKKNKKILTMAGSVMAILAVTVCIVMQMTVNIKAEDNERIVDGVYIGDINVGGMTEEEATAAIDSYIENATNAEFVLAVDDRNIIVSAEQMGLSVEANNAVQEAMDICRSGNLIKRYKDSKDLEQGNKVIPMPVTVDHNALTTLLGNHLAELNIEAVDNGLIRENGAFTFVEGNAGIEINIEESVSAIETFLQNSWDGSSTQIELVAEVTEPKGTREELSKVQDLLGSYSTNYSTSAAGRCTNISVATSKINGALLYPGDEFSVGQTINPMTAENGYELAGSYENGTTVQSYGGGVCQVSTTLYNAVILAELEVTQRSNHSMIVTYVKPSMDAAIAGDYKDFKFVNNTDAPIYIEGYTSGKNVYFNIYGEETRPENREVSYVSEIVSQTDPGVQFVATADPVGYIAKTQSSHTGYVATLWKVVTVDGVEQSREKFNSSTYKPSPRIMNVGTASADPNVTAAMNAAIATGDEATIMAAIAQYSGTATTPATTTQEQQPVQTQQPAQNQQPAQTTQPEQSQTTQPESQTPSTDATGGAESDAGSADANQSTDSSGNE